MSDGTIIINTRVDDEQAAKDLARLNRKIQKLEDQIYTKRRQQLPIVEQSREMAATLDAAKAKLAEMQSGKEFFTTSQIGEQATLVKQMQKEWDSVQNKVEQYDRSIEKSNIELNLANERAGAINEQMVHAATDSGVMSQAVARADAAMEKFSRRVKGLAKRVLVFTVIAGALRGLKSYVVDVITANDEAAASIAQLKGALLTLAQPIVSAVIPALTILLNILTKIVTAIASIVSWLFGSTLKSSAAAAKAFNDETVAIEAVGDAAKETQKNLSGLDEINTWQSDSGGSGGGGGGAASQEKIKPSFDFSEMESALSEITRIVSIAALAVGAVLVFSGANIPLGIALMALGAAGLVSEAALNWGSTEDLVKIAISGLEAIVGAAFLAIGGLLAFSGANVPLGIAFLAAGAVTVMSAIALNWENLNPIVKGVIADLEGAVGGAALAMGALLAFSGVSLPLGLAFLAAGALAVITAAKLKWDEAPNKTKAVAGIVTSVVSGALLAVGALLTFGGVNLPLGIALMAAGAIGLVAATGLNWDKTTKMIKTVLSSILAIISGSLLAVGVLLCLSGAGLGLGLALIAAGIAGSFTAWKIDNNPVTNFVKKMANGIINIINKLVDWINSKLHISFDGLTIAGKTIIPAFDKQLLRVPHIPALATGAVIPPNREFMAVLGDQKQGTNIETPENLLRQIMREELGKRGGNSYSVNATANGRVLFRVIIDEAKQEKTRTGRNPFDLT